MKVKMMLTVLVAMLALSLGARAEEGKQPKSPFTKDSCCAKKYVAGEACQHPCCLEAAKENKVCKKCNSGADEAKPAFKDGGCCAKEYKQGKVCQHPCCLTAAKANGKCEKCNKEEKKPS